MEFYTFFEILGISLKILSISNSRCENLVFLNFSIEIPSISTEIQGFRSKYYLVFRSKTLDFDWNTRFFIWIRGILKKRDNRIPHNTESIFTEIYLPFIVNPFIVGILYRSPDKINFEIFSQFKKLETQERYLLGHFDKNLVCKSE